MDSKSINTNRIQILDLYRFIAAFTIILTHYSFRGFAADNMTLMSYPALAPAVKYGFVSVELFFMISGFVILMTAWDSDVPAFISSRIGRLFPAFWACCTITYIVTLLIGDGRYVVTLKEYLVSMTMLSEFVHVKSVDGVYWTLMYEIRFYFLIAVLLFFRQIKKCEVYVYGWMLAAMFFIHFGDFGFPPFRILKYVLIADYSSSFIAGTIFYLIWKNGVSRLRIFFLAASFEASVFTAMKRVVVEEAHYNTDYSRILVVALILVLYTVFMLTALNIISIRANKAVMYLGAVTYPLYLMHQHIGFMLFNKLFYSVNRHILFWGVIALMLAVALIISQTIEKKYCKPLRIFGLNLFRSIDNFRLEIKERIDVALSK